MSERWRCCRNGYEGSVTIKAGTTAGLDVTFNAAADAISAQNDAAVTGDDIKIGDVTSTLPVMSLTATNDVSLIGDIASTVTAGSITVSGGGDVISPLASRLKLRMM